MCGKNPGKRQECLEEENRFREWLAQGWGGQSTDFKESMSERKLWHTAGSV